MAECLSLLQAAGMKNRRTFLKAGALGAMAAALPWNKGLARVAALPEGTKGPKVISTWAHGMAANDAAWKVLSSGGRALDAVEAGVRVTESDPENTSVGLGGMPDRDGNVTLDACIMNEQHECGSVAFLQHIENPISVARKVMEETPHVMLAGEGALEFALAQGFEKTELLTPNAKAAWQKWLKENPTYQYTPNIENHDTIGMLAIDANGDLSGACTTSGMAFKMHGRVGDSPIIGASLYVDNEIGGACATGVGEMVIRIAGSHLVVEMMRQGHSPTQACKIAVERILSKHKSVENMQVGFLAMNKAGETGSYSIYSGFNYAEQSEEKTELLDAQHLFEWE